MKIFDFFIYIDLIYILMKQGINMNKREIEKKLEKLNMNIDYYKKVYSKSDTLKEFYKERRILKKLPK